MPGPSKVNMPVCAHSENTEQTAHTQSALNFCCVACILCASQGSHYMSVKTLIDTVAYAGWPIYLLLKCQNN